jgi:hypothetical protein
MNTLKIVIVAGLATAARAQSITYSVVLSTAGPAQHGAVVTGTLRCAWQDPAGIGYAGGAFRLRMDGLGITDVLVPNNSNNGANSEPTNQRVGVPLSEIPPGSGYATIGDNWTSGRRPKRAYIQIPGDPTGLVSGGGFRYPITGNGGPLDLHYSVEQQAGVTYLTGRNGGLVENQIEHNQYPPALQADPLFFEPAASLNLFKFQVRAPLHGEGTATITPEILSASIFTSPTGTFDLLTTDQITAIGGSFTYSPAPPSLAPLAIALAALARRRARSNA